MARLIAVVVAAVALIVGAPVFIFGLYLPRFVTTDGAVSRATCERSPMNVVKPSGRLTVVIVDGLGFEYARGLPELGWLRAEGATRPLVVEFPSYTTPALLGFVTGLGPRDGGIRLNAPVRVAAEGLDHLGVTARESGKPATYFDRGWEPFEDIVVADPRELWRGQLTAEAAPFITRAPGELRIVYFGDIDEEGHKHGAASEEYRDAAVRAARYLARYRATLGDGDRMLVVSDHGHVPTGGHGGVEPEVLQAMLALIGHGVRVGVELEPRPAVDVASTIAVLAGIPTPACNLGRPMLDLVEIADEDRARLLAPAFHQGARMLCRLYPSDGCDRVADMARDLAQGRGLVDAERFVDAVRERRESALAEAETSARRLRMAVALSLPCILLFVARRRIPPLRAWATPLLLAAVYTGFLAVRGYRLTFSKMPQQPDFVRDATIAALLAVVLACIVGLRGPGRDRDIAALVGVLLPFTWMAAWVGLDHHTLPTPYVGLATILWSPLIIAASVCAIVLAVSASRRAPENPDLAASGAPRGAAASASRRAGP